MLGMGKKSDCFSCPRLDKKGAQAIKALGKGEADEYQQRLALKIIINDFSRSHDLCYVPDSHDQSSFLAGRAFVGQKILRCLNIPIGKLVEEAKEENEAN